MTVTFAQLIAAGIDPDMAIAFLYEKYGFDTDQFYVEGTTIYIAGAADTNSNEIPDMLESLMDPGYVANPSELGHGG